MQSESISVHNLLQDLLRELQEDRLRNEGMIIGVKLAWAKITNEDRMNAEAKDRKGEESGAESNKSGLETSPAE